MKVVGLTGGIATGKSTVASMLRDLGAEVISADDIAREIVRPGQEAWREIVDAFGTGILRKDKTINRAKLRKIIFQDEKARKKLESITHPRIRAAALERIKNSASETAEVVVYEAPLFFENQIHIWLRPVVLVAADERTQKKRLRERDGLSDVEIQQHLAAQMPMEDKRKLADFIIENDGDLDQLRRQVVEVWEKIHGT